MTKYSVVVSKQALKELEKLDKQTARFIVSWITKNLEGCENPRNKGKPLKGKLCKFWRYRIGDYRILCEIKDKEIIIIIVAVGHRREIYDD